MLCRSGFVTPTGTFAYFNNLETLNFKAGVANPVPLGSVNLISDTHEQGCAYIFRVSKDVLPTDASGSKVVATVAQSKYEVSGLVVGCYYYFDVAIVTPTGTTDFCAPVKKLVV